MEQYDKALNLLGLARKGGNLQLGEENTGSAARAGKARLLLLAADAADNAVNRMTTFSQGGKVPVLRVPWGKERFGAAFGKAVCAMAAVTDVQLALAFVRALGRPEDEALLPDLERRVERVKQRRKEEKAHRNNVKRGKKS